MVLDNPNTHKPKEDRWLKAHPNVVRSHAITGNGRHGNCGRCEKVPGRKVKEICAGQLRKDEELRIRKRVQVIVEVEVEAVAYASEQYQSRITAPSACPNCGIAQSLEAHGYYWRWVTEALCGRVVRMAVRRFFVGAAQ